MRRYNYLYFIIFFILSCTENDKYFSESFDVLPDSKSYLRVDPILENSFLSIGNNDKIYTTNYVNKGSVSLPNLNLDKIKFNKTTYRYSNKSIKAPFFIQPVIRNGVAYIADVAGGLSAYDIKYDKILWQRNLINHNDKYNNLSGGITFDDNKLYIINGSDFLYAMNALNGEILWNVDIGFNARSKPFIYKNRVVISRIDNYLISFNKLNGKRLWGIKYDDYIASLYQKNIPIAKGNLLLNGNELGELSLHDLNKGQILWKDNLSSSNISSEYHFSDIITSPLLHNNIVYAISNNGFLSAYEIFSGSKLWELKVSSNRDLWFTENLIFLINKEQNLIALSPNNGAIKWMVNLNKDEEEVSFYGPQVINKHVVISNNKGKLFLFNYNDGELLKTYKIPKNINHFPIIADNKLFFVDNSSKFYIFD